MNICVFGSSAPPKNENYTRLVLLLGEKLAKRGHTLVYGGGKDGLMGSAAIGADRAGGEIIGIAPEFMGPLEMPFEKCTQFIRTETMSERKNKMDELSDAYIAVPGGIGTLDEIFEVMTLRGLGRHQKPIVFFNPDGFYGDLIDFLKKLKAEGLIYTETELYRAFSDPDELIAYIEAF